MVNQKVLIEFKAFSLLLLVKKSFSPHAQSYFAAAFILSIFFFVASMVGASSQIYVTLSCLITSCAHFEKFGSLSNPSTTD
jgi:hypothetical protein